MNRSTFAVAVWTLATCAAAFGEPRVARIDKPEEPVTPVSAHVGGRVLVSSTNKTYTYQWPGAYFECALVGPRAYFRVGAGEVTLQVSVDGRSIMTLTKPAVGWYRVDDLGAGEHLLRVQMSSEIQTAANTFAGFALPKQSTAAPPPNRLRQIEFIGDSHTVGYGNTSTKRECSIDEVGSTTDTTRAFGPMIARKYGAEYQVNAISGRGVVRNYNGGEGATLPQAYPYALLDSKSAYRDSTWNPQVVVISLGTNDFSTALNPGERWESRAALHQDYESTFLEFVQDLRRTHHDAFFIFWATSAVNDEIRNAAERVVEDLRRNGEQRVVFIPVDGLEMTGCHWHPSLADHGKIASALQAFIDGHLEVWRGL